MSTLIGLTAHFLPVRIQVLSVPQVGLPIEIMNYIFNTSMFVLNLAVESYMGCFAFAGFVVAKHSSPLPGGENLFWTGSKSDFPRVSPCLAVTDKSLFTLTT